MATVIFLLGRLAIGDRYAEIPNAHGGAADVPGLIFLAVTTAVTAVSGISYCWKNKELIQAR